MADQLIDFAVFAAVSPCGVAVVEQAYGIAVFAGGIAGDVAGILAAGSVVMLERFELRLRHRRTML
ncbi:MAG: hypothetical protein ACXVCX_00310 [Ktedonobacterales bacterium]